MIEKNFCTKKCLRPEDARRDIRPGGKLYKERLEVESILVAHKGERVKKSTLSTTKQHQAAARMASALDHVGCDVMTNNNADERSYWWIE